MGESPNTEMSDAFAKAVELHKKSELDAAMAEYSSVLMLNPHHADALHLLGVVHAQKGAPAEAVRYIKQALSINDTHPAYYFNLANAEIELEQWGNACHHYQCCLQYKSDYMQAVAALRRVALYYKAGERMEEALSVWLWLNEHCANYDVECNKAELFNELGLCYEFLRNLPEAERWYALAVGMLPDNAVLNRNYAGVLHMQQKFFEAVHYYKEALRLQPDIPGVKHALASLDGSNPDKADAEYVAQLFDGYAHDFESQLKQLGYIVPERVAELCQEWYPNAHEQLRIMDLGCGTGSGGNLIQMYANYLAGVDLSANMVEKARLLGCYDALYVGDVVEVLRNEPEPYDLIIALDVLVYIGDLRPLFAVVRNALRSGGAFVFSTEWLGESGGYLLRESGRYAHSDAYVGEVAAEYGLDIVFGEQSAYRKNWDMPVPGKIYRLVRRISK